MVNGKQLENIVSQVGSRSFHGKKNNYAAVAGKGKGHLTLSGI